MSNNDIVLIDTSLSYYKDGVRNDINSFDISNLTHGNEYFIRFSSEYVNIVPSQIEPVNVEYVGFEESITTLNENEAYNILSLNNSKNVVFDILNPGVPSKNVVEISGVSYTLFDTNLIDISYLQLGVTYDISTTTHYTPITPSTYISYETREYVNNSTITINNEDYPTAYIANGKFYSSDSSLTYDKRFENTLRTRTTTSQVRGMYLIQEEDIKNWEFSQSIFIA